MSKRTRGDLQLILPREGSSTVSLLKEDSTKVTKIIDFQIEDFMIKLNDGVRIQDLDGNGDFLESPRVVIGEQGVCFSCWIHESDDVSLRVVNDEGCDNLMSLLVTGNCGNLTLEKSEKDENGLEVLCVELGSMEELKNAMTNSGNHKLDLQVTVTFMVPENKDDNGQWIIHRYDF